MPRHLFRTILFVLSCLAAGLSPLCLLAQTGYGVTTAGQLARFDAATPGTISLLTSITGLGGGETIRAIDFRPATGELYALGSLSRLYVINTSTAVATQLGASGAFTLSGNEFGFDFNPTVDRIRVVSDLDQNLRLNPSSGGLAATDTQLAYNASDPNVGFNPGVVGSAYTNNFAGATTTTLYGIDSNLDVLVIQNPPNGGTLNTIGPLGANATAVLGFDIVTAAGVNYGYAALQVGVTSGLYRINLATGAATLVGNFPAGVTIRGLAFAPDPPRLANISSRAQVLTGNDVMIGGFVIGGSFNKTVVVRARGPSLVPFGVTNALADPTLQLVRSSDQATIGFNDNWQDAANAAAVQASGFAPSNNLESAILVSLAPGAYTAIVSGVGGTTGTGIVEVFEVDAITVPLVNISTRARVLTGNDVLIGGFVIHGNGPQKVAIRARGPSLTSFGVAGALADPALQLFSGVTQIAFNDNWQDAPNQPEIQASGFVVSDPRESIILMTLDPGAYTAIVTGVGGTTGVGIVEVFATQ